MQGPTPTSNWLIKDKILTGAYPYNIVTHTSRVPELRKANVTLYISLQEEKELKNFCAYTNDLLPNESYINFPIPEKSIVDDEKAISIVNYIFTQYNEGKVIYLHCHGGRGRTGTISCLLLRKIYCISGHDSLDMWIKLYNERYKANSIGTLTKSQENQVRRIPYKKLLTLKRKNPDE